MLTGAIVEVVWGIAAYSMKAPEVIMTCLLSCLFKPYVLCFQKYMVLVSEINGFCSVQKIHRWFITVTGVIKVGFFKKNILSSTVNGFQVLLSKISDDRSLKLIITQQLILWNLQQWGLSITSQQFMNQHTYSYQCVQPCGFQDGKSPLKTCWEIIVKDNSWLAGDCSTNGSSQDDCSALMLQEQLRLCDFCERSPNTSAGHC